jgi:hypothetical protein
VLVLNPLDVPKQPDDPELQLSTMIRTVAEDEGMLPADAPGPHPITTTKFRELNGIDTGDAENPERQIGVEIMMALRKLVEGSVSNRAVMENDIGCVQREAPERNRHDHTDGGRALHQDANQVQADPGGRTHPVARPHVDEGARSKCRQLPTCVEITAGKQVHHEKRRSWRDQMRESRVTNAPRRRDMTEESYSDLDGQIMDK